jgi:uncharacterized protein (TIGR00730 family)
MQIRPGTNLVVCCSSKDDCPEIYKKYAYEIGVFLAQHNFHVYIDGANIGLLKIIGDAIQAHQGIVYPVITKDLGYDLSVKMENLIICSTNSDRKVFYQKKADIFFILPGGYGTLDELSYFICLNYTKVINKPIILFNIDCFWNPFISMINTIQKTHCGPTIDEFLFVENSFDRLKNHLLSIS